MLDDCLSFEPQGHVYRYNGRVVPSVTQCLSIVNDLSFVNPARLEAARAFGVNVHLAVEFWNRGTLDVESLDPELLPYLQGWLKFTRESGVEITASEQRIYNKQLRYAGCVDAVGSLRGE